MKRRQLREGWGRAAGFYCSQKLGQLIGPDLPSQQVPTPLPTLLLAAFAVPSPVQPAHVPLTHLL